ncbi:MULTISPECIES: WXG100 family type VII secretion target [Amycolatopsis]|uniref:WXG100 family type VII secretion target n=1 Tax=Amycolatopsis tucumanensis TaxID=401106 RepID=A0ABP7JE38_9PSEU|nr:MULTISPECIES: WXG100 family type VII secretion target [Amycolatopsis]MCF6423848.1 WXG100 family type VII secretion target [Amycolatopsis tucumanensis]
MVLRYDGTVGDTGTTNITKSGELIQLFEQFKQKAKNILAEDWNGAAATAFDEAQEIWNQRVNNFGSTHQDMGNAVIRAAENAFDKDMQARGYFNI